MNFSGQLSSKEESGCVGITYSSTSLGSDNLQGIILWDYLKDSRKLHLISAV
jgi:hypothetical protein